MGKGSIRIMSGFQVKVENDIFGPLMKLGKHFTPKNLVWTNSLFSPQKKVCSTFYQRINRFRPPSPEKRNSI